MSLVFTILFYVFSCWFRVVYVYVARYSVVSLNGHLVKRDVLFVGDEVKEGRVVTVAITFVVNSKGGTTRYIADAAAHGSETITATRSIMMRAIESSNSIAPVKAIIVDRNRSNLGVITDMENNGTKEFHVLYCCLHDITAILKEAYTKAKGENFFKNSKLLKNMSCVQTLVENLSINRLNLQKFQTVIPHMAELIDAAAHQDNNSCFKTIVEVLAALSTCLSLFKKPLGHETEMELQAVLKIFNGTVVRVGSCKLIIESINQHIQLAKATGIPHYIDDFTLVTDYSIRDRISQGTKNKSSLSKFAQKIVNYAVKGVTLHGGVFGKVNAKIEPLPLGFAAHHFMHLATDKMHPISVITTTASRLKELRFDRTNDTFTDDDLKSADSICQAIQSHNEFSKSPKIENIKKIILKLYRQTKPMEITKY